MYLFNFSIYVLFVFIQYVTKTHVLKGGEDVLSEERM